MPLNRKGASFLSSKSRRTVAARSANYFRAPRLAVFSHDILLSVARKRQLLHHARLLCSPAQFAPKTFGCSVDQYESAVGSRLSPTPHACCSKLRQLTNASTKRSRDLLARAFLGFPKDNSRRRVGVAANGALAFLILSSSAMQLVFFRGLFFGADFEDGPDGTYIGDIG